MGPDLDDVAVFDPARALDLLDGDFELLIDVVELFRNSSRRILVELTTAVEGLDFVAASACAHSIKGAASNVSAERVRRVADFGEQHLTADAPDSVTRWAEAWLAGLREEVDRYHAATEDVASNWTS